MPSSDTARYVIKANGVTRGWAASERINIAKLDELQVQCPSRDEIPDFIMADRSFDLGAPDSVLGRSLLMSRQPAGLNLAPPNVVLPKLCAVV